MNRRQFIALASAGSAVFSGRAAFAGSPKIYKEDGVALGGTDAVAFHEGLGPVAGSRSYGVRWMGAEWHFASASNRSAFEMNPHRFAPEYGGYCAYTVSQGALASTDPAAWTLHEGRLYLNYSLEVRELWRENIAGNIAKADTNWPGLLSG